MLGRLRRPSVWLTPRQSSVANFSLDRGPTSALRALVWMIDRDCPINHLAPQVREHGEYAAVVVAALADAELEEDVAHVRLDGLRAEEELLADALVRVSLCDQREHLALALRQLVEQALLAPAAHQSGDDRRIEHALA